MAVEVACGVLTKPTTEAPFDQSVTGLSFTPKLVLFKACNVQAQDAQEDDSTLMFGASDATTDWCFGGSSTHDLATSDNRRWATNAACVRHYIPSSAVVQYSATIKTLDAGGFTLTWDTNNAEAVRIAWCALGGDDVSVAVGYTASRVSAGTQEVGAFGFTPTGLLLCNTFESSPTQNNVGNSFNLGFADGTNTWQVAMGAGDAQAVGDAAQQASDSLLYVLLNNNSPHAAATLATLQSFNEGSFTLSFTTATSSRYFGWVAIGGVQCHVGDTTTRDSAGAQILGPAAFRPGFVLLSGLYDTQALGSVYDHARLGIGWGVAGQTSCILSQSTDGADPTVEKAYMGTGVLALGDGSTDPQVLATLTSLSSSGAALTFSASDGVYPVGYLMLEGGGVEGPTPDHSYQHQRAANGTFRRSWSN